MRGLRPARAAPLAALALTGCVAAPHRAAVEPDIGPAPQAELAPASEAPLAPALSRTEMALRLAGTGDRAAGAGTLLAPTDAAWARLAPGVAGALLLPGNRPSLRLLLRYWTVPGRLTAADLRARARAAAASGTPARLPTVEGEPLLLVRDGADAVLVDGAGRRARVLADVPLGTGGAVAVDGVVAPASIAPGGADTPR